MRPQKVSVNVWQMIVSSCSYLLLAFLAWVFLRLVQACFWFPAFLNGLDNDPAKVSTTEEKNENKTENKTEDKKDK